jgi:integrase
MSPLDDGRLGLMPTYSRPTLEADWNDALRAGLRWADVDINAQRLHVRRRLYHGIDAPKSRYGRRDIPLAPRMLAALQHRRATTR